MQLELEEIVKGLLARTLRSIPEGTDIEALIQYGKDHQLFIGAITKGQFSVAFWPERDERGNLMQHEIEVTSAQGVKIKVLHNTIGPAVTFRNFKCKLKYLYYMWGVGFNAVGLSKWVTTPASKLDPAEALKLVSTNVAQGQAVLRKIGANRMYALLPHRILDEGDVIREYQEVIMDSGEILLAALNLPITTVDGRKPRETRTKVRSDHYILYELNFTGDNNDKRDLRLYLHMVNPSVPDKIVLEPVSPECKTIRDALSCRDNKGKIIPDYRPASVLT